MPLSIDRTRKGNQKPAGSRGRHTAEAPGFRRCHAHLLMNSSDSLRSEEGMSEVTQWTTGSQGLVASREPDSSLPIVSSTGSRCSCPQTGCLPRWYCNTFRLSPFVEVIPESRIATCSAAATLLTNTSVRPTEPLRDSEGRMELRGLNDTTTKTTNNHCVLTLLSRHMH